MTFYKLLFWTIVASGVLGGRALGSLLGRRTGVRHAVAWFGALAGFTATVVAADALINMAKQPGWCVQDLKNNLKDWQLAGCLIYGVVVAFVVEVIASLVEMAIRSAKSGGAADSIDGPRPRLFCLRSLLVIVVMGGILYAAYRVSITPMFRWQRTHERIRSMVDSLAQHRPKEVTRKQWVWVVGWTHNGVDNCFFSPSHIKDEERYYRFADELEQKLRGEVDMSTIDWIWDEFEQVSTNGQHYSENWRPTTPEHFREAGPYDFGIDVP